MPLVATRGAASAQGFGEFGAVAAPTYIEDVFSTYLYTGNGSTQTITNGIDLSGKGGLVWIKGRSGATGHRLTDTARGATKSLESNSAAAAVTESTGLTAFNGTGFSIGADADYNTNTATYVSWAFREQAKFFDVVTYTGNGAAGRTVTHNLGSTPGCIIVKCISTGYNWAVWHRSVPTQKGFLNLTSAFSADTQYFDSTGINSTQIKFATDTGEVNQAGDTYVAYLFAHDAGGFGLTGTDNVISCGSFTTNGSGAATVTLNYEPQWLMIKRTDNVGNWILCDSMRGLTVGGIDPILYPNSSTSEDTSADYFSPTATGFTVQNINASATFIYIAIRRGPMKVPTSGTSVFTPVARTGTGADATVTAGFPVDMAMTAQRTNVGATNRFGVVSRLTGAPYLITWLTNAETSDAAWYQTNPFDNQTALKIGTGAGSSGTNNNANTYINHLFRRAPGFFDVVAYTGTGVSFRALSHNLAVEPELIIFKSRSFATNWYVMHGFDVSDYKRSVLDLTNAQVTLLYADNVDLNARPTSTTLSLSSAGRVNGSGQTYVAYLFATVPSVSKVGSYTGNGTSQTINCGFTTGARYILIKKTSGTGDWYVWDSARGIVAGNDPNLQLNTNNPESGVPEDVVDTASTGFIVNNTGGSFLVNDNGATYIFLAIA